ncbi:DUF2799 domain-containing protein [Planktotalea sp.]|uniref:DUF2799 domain-containing protein n=1 Tax=Planktotalea sp. TaxID=2029877 RepID=UPI003D6A1964
MRLKYSLCLLIALAGCATLSEEECLNGNWQEIGLKDGANGKTSDFIQSHAKACEKVGVVPVQSLWEKGRQQGLPAYCVPQKAYSEGRRGRRLSAVCPAEKIPELRAANDRGMKYYDYSAEINSLQYRIGDIERALIGEKSPAKRAFFVQDIHLIRSQIQLLELKRSLVSSL